MAPLFTNVDVVQHIIEEAGLEPRELPVSPILEQRKQVLLTVLPGLSGAEESGIFAENFFQDNDIDAYRNEVDSLFDRMGPIKRTLEIEPENQLRGTFQIEGENGVLEVFFSLTPESEPKIQALELEMLEPIATN